MAYAKRDHSPRTNPKLVEELWLDLDSALKLLHKKERQLSNVLAINAGLNSALEGLQRDNNQLRLDLALAIRRAMEACG